MHLQWVMQGNSQKVNNYFCIQFLSNAFYLLFIVGLVYFVIMPGIEAGSISKIIVGGLLFGFMTYATYDLTNLATLKDWPIVVTVVDLVWGSTLSTVISVVTYYLYNLFW